MKRQRITEECGRSNKSKSILQFIPYFPQDPEIMDQIAIETFQKLVQFNTTTGSGVSSGNYTRCADFIAQRCLDINLHVRKIELIPGKPIVLASLIGRNESLPSLLLTGHYDVVPCDLSKWTVDPFAGLIINGKLYGRGTQDMKVCLAAYIEALRRLGKSYIPERSIHLLFLPDEEIGGSDGMGVFVKTDLFRSLNIGFALDEGLASPTATVPVYFGERAIWWIKLKSKGTTGHASRYLDKNGAMEQLHKSCEKAYIFRESEAEKFRSGTSCIDEIVTLNCTSLKAGHSLDNGETFALNVIPSNAEAGFDIRIPPGRDLHEFERDFKSLVLQDNVEYEKLNGSMVNESTSIDPVKNAWWKKFAETCNQLGLDINAGIFPAATDSRFLRELGIPAIGFTPIPNTPVLFHDHDEYVGIDEYLAAIEIYKFMIPSLVSLVG